MVIDGSSLKYENGNLAGFSYTDSNGIKHDVKITWKDGNIESIEVSNWSLKVLSADKFGVPQSITMVSGGWKKGDSNIPKEVSWLFGLSGESILTEAKRAQFLSQYGTYGKVDSKTYSKTSYTYNSDGSIKSTHTESGEEGSIKKEVKDTENLEINGFGQVTKQKTITQKTGVDIKDASNVVVTGTKDGKVTDGYYILNGQQVFFHLDYDSKGNLSGYETWTVDKDGNKKILESVSDMQYDKDDKLISFKKDMDGDGVKDTVNVTYDTKTGTAIYNWTDGAGVKHTLSKSSDSSKSDTTGGPQKGTTTFTHKTEIGGKNFETTAKETDDGKTKTYSFESKSTTPMSWGGGGVPGGFDNKSEFNKLKDMYENMLGLKPLNSVTEETSELVYNDKGQLIGKTMTDKKGNITSYEYSYNELGNTWKVKIKTKDEVEIKSGAALQKLVKELYEKGKTDEITKWFMTLNEATRNFLLNLLRERWGMQIDYKLSDTELEKSLKDSLAVSLYTLICSESEGMRAEELDDQLKELAETEKEMSSNDLTKVLSNLSAVYMWKVFSNMNDKDKITFLVLMRDILKILPPNDSANISTLDTLISLGSVPDPSSLAYFLNVIFSSQTEILKIFETVVKQLNTAEAKNSANLSKLGNSALLKLIQGEYAKDKNAAKSIEDDIKKYVGQKVIEEKEEIKYIEYDEAGREESVTRIIIDKSAPTLSKTEKTINEYGNCDQIIKSTKINIETGERADLTAFINLLGGLMGDYSDKKMQDALKDSNMTLDQKRTFLKWMIKEGYITGTDAAKIDNDKDLAEALFKNIVDGTKNALLASIYVNMKGLKATELCTYYLINKWYESKKTNDRDLIKDIVDAVLGKDYSSLPIYEKLYKFYSKVRQEGGLENVFNSYKDSISNLTSRLEKNIYTEGKEITENIYDIYGMVVVSNVTTITSDAPNKQAKDTIVYEYDRLGRAVKVHTYSHDSGKLSEAEAFVAAMKKLAESGFKKMMEEYGKFASGMIAGVGFTEVFLKSVMTLYLPYILMEIMKAFGVDTEGLNLWDTDAIVKKFYNFILSSSTEQLEAIMKHFGEKLSAVIGQNMFDQVFGGLFQADRDYKSASKKTVTNEYDINGEISHYTEEKIDDLINAPNVKNIYDYHIAERDKRGNITKMTQIDRQTGTMTDMEALKAWFTKAGAKDIRDLICTNGKLDEAKTRAFLAFLNALEIKVNGKKLTFELWALDLTSHGGIKEYYILAKYNGGGFTIDDPLNFDMDLSKAGGTLGGSGSLWTAISTAVTGLSSEDLGKVLDKAKGFKDNAVKGLNHTINSYKTHIVENMYDINGKKVKTKEIATEPNNDGKVDTYITYNKWWDGEIWRKTAYHKETGTYTDMEALSAIASKDPEKIADWILGLNENAKKAVMKFIVLYRGMDFVFKINDKELTIDQLSDNDWKNLSMAQIYYKDKDGKLVSVMKKDLGGYLADAITSAKSSQKDSLDELTKQVSKSLDEFKKYYDKYPKVYVKISTTDANMSEMKEWIKQYRAISNLLGEITKIVEDGKKNNLTASQITSKLQDAFVLVSEAVLWVLWNILKTTDFAKSQNVDLNVEVNKKDEIISQLVILISEGYLSLSLSPGLGDKETGVVNKMAMLKNLKDIQKDIGIALTAAENYLTALQNREKKTNKDADINALLAAGNLKENLNYNLNYETYTETINSYNDRHQKTGYVDVIRKNSTNVITTCEGIIEYNGLGQEYYHKIINMQTGEKTDAELADELLSGLFDYLNSSDLNDVWKNATLDEKKALIQKLLKAGIITLDKAQYEEFLKDSADKNKATYDDIDWTKVTAEDITDWEIDDKIKNNGSEYLAQMWFGNLDKTTQGIYAKLYKALFSENFDKNDAKKIKKLFDELKKAVSNVKDRDARYLMEEDTTVGKALKQVVKEMGHTINSEKITETYKYYDNTGRLISKATVTTTPGSVVQDKVLEDYTYNKGTGTIDKTKIINIKKDIFLDDAQALIYNMRNMTAEEFADWMLNLDYDTIALLLVYLGAANWRGGYNIGEVRDKNNVVIANENFNLLQLIGLLKGEYKAYDKSGSPITIDKTAFEAHIRKIFIENSRSFMGKITQDANVIVDMMKKGTSSKAFFDSLNNMAQENENALKAKRTKIEQDIYKNMDSYKKMLISDWKKNFNFLFELTKFLYGYSSSSSTWDTKFYTGWYEGSVSIEGHLSLKDIIYTTPSSARQKFGAMLWGDQLTKFMDLLFIELTALMKDSNYYGYVVGGSDFEDVLKVSVSGDLAKEFTGKLKEWSDTFKKASADTSFGTSANPRVLKTGDFFNNLRTNKTTEQEKTYVYDAEGRLVSYTLTTKGKNNYENKVTHNLQYRLGMISNELIYDHTTGTYTETEKLQEFLGNLDKLNPSDLEKMFKDMKEDYKDGLLKGTKQSILIALCTMGFLDEDPHLLGTKTKEEMQNIMSKVTGDMLMGYLVMLWFGQSLVQDFMNMVDSDQSAIMELLKKYNIGGDGTGALNKKEVSGAQLAMLLMMLLRGTKIAGAGISSGERAKGVDLLLKGSKAETVLKFFKLMGVDFKNLDSKNIDSSLKSIGKKLGSDFADSFISSNDGKDFLNNVLGRQLDSVKTYEKDYNYDQFGRKIMEETTTLDGASPRKISRTSEYYVYNSIEQISMQYTIEREYDKEDISRLDKQTRTIKHNIYDGKGELTRTMEIITSNDSPSKNKIVITDLTNDAYGKVSKKDITEYTTGKLEDGTNVNKVKNTLQDLYYNAAGEIIKDRIIERDDSAPDLFTETITEYKRNEFGQITSKKMITHIYGSYNAELLNSTNIEEQVLSYDQYGRLARIASIETSSMTKMKNYTDTVNIYNDLGQIKRQEKTSQSFGTSIYVAGGIILDTRYDSYNQLHTIIVKMGNGRIVKVTNIGMDYNGNVTSMDVVVDGKIMRFTKIEIVYFEGQAYLGYWLDGVKQDWQGNRIEEDTYGSRTYKSDYQPADLMKSFLYWDGSSYTLLLNQQRMAMLYTSTEIGYDRYGRTVKQTITKVTPQRNGLVDVTETTIGYNSMGWKAWDNSIERTDGRDWSDVNKDKNDPNYEELNEETLKKLSEIPEINKKILEKLKGHKYYTFADGEYREVTIKIENGEIKLYYKDSKGNWQEVSENTKLYTKSYEWVQTGETQEYVEVYKEKSIDEEKSNMRKEMDNFLNDNYNFGKEVHTKKETYTEYVYDGKGRVVDSDSYTTSYKWEREKGYTKDELHSYEVYKSNIQYNNLGQEAEWDESGTGNWTYDDGKREAKYSYSKKVQVAYDPYGREISRNETNGKANYIGWEGDYFVDDWKDFEKNLFGMQKKGYGELGEVIWRYSEVSKKETVRIRYDDFGRETGSISQSIGAVNRGSRTNAGFDVTYSKVYNGLEQVIYEDGFSWTFSSKGPDDSYSQKRTHISTTYDSSGFLVGIDRYTSFEHTVSIHNVTIEECVFIAVKTIVMAVVSVFTFGTGLLISMAIAAIQAIVSWVLDNAFKAIAWGDTSGFSNWEGLLVGVAISVAAAAVSYAASSAASGFEGFQAVGQFKDVFAQGVAEGLKTIASSVVTGVMSAYITGFISSVIMHAFESPDSVLGTVLSTLASSVASAVIGSVSPSDHAQGRTVPSAQYYNIFSNPIRELIAIAGKTLAAYIGKAAQVAIQGGEREGVIKIRDGVGNVDVELRDQQAKEGEGYGGFDWGTAGFWAVLTNELVNSYVPIAVNFSYGYAIKLISEISQGNKIISEAKIAVEKEAKGEKLTKEELAKRIAEKTGIKQDLILRALNGDVFAAANVSRDKRRHDNIDNANKVKARAKDLLPEWAYNNFENFLKKAEENKAYVGFFDTGTDTKLEAYIGFIGTRESINEISGDSRVQLEESWRDGLAALEMGDISSANVYLREVNIILNAEKGSNKFQVLKISDEQGEFEKELNRSENEEYKKNIEGETNSEKKKEKLTDLAQKVLGDKEAKSDLREAAGRYMMYRIEYFDRELQILPGVKVLKEGYKDMPLTKRVEELRRQISKFREEINGKDSKLTEREKAIFNKTLDKIETVLARVEDMLKSGRVYDAQITYEIAKVGFTLTQRAYGLIKELDELKLNKDAVSNLKELGVTIEKLRDYVTGAVGWVGEAMDEALKGNYKKSKLLLKSSALMLETVNTYISLAKSLGNIKEYFKDSIKVEDIKKAMDKAVDVIQEAHRKISEAKKGDDMKLKEAEVLLIRAGKLITAVNNIAASANALRELDGKVNTEKFNEYRKALEVTVLEYKEKMSQIIKGDDAEMKQLDIVSAALITKTKMLAGTADPAVDAAMRTIMEQAGISEDDLLIVTKEKLEKLLKKLEGKTELAEKILMVGAISAALGELGKDIPKEIMDALIGALNDISNGNLAEAKMKIAEAYEIMNADLVKYGDAMEKLSGYVDMFSEGIFLDIAVAESTGRINKGQMTILKTFAYFVQIQINAGKKGQAELLNTMVRQYLNASNIKFKNTREDIQSVLESFMREQRKIVESGKFRFIDVNHIEKVQMAVQFALLYDTSGKAGKFQKVIDTAVSSYRDIDLGRLKVMAGAVLLLSSGRDMDINGVKLSTLIGGITDSISFNKIAGILANNISAGNLLIDAYKFINLQKVLSQEIRSLENLGDFVKLTEEERKSVNTKINNLKQLNELNTKVLTAITEKNVKAVVKLIKEMRSLIQDYIEFGVNIQPVVSVLKESGAGLWAVNKSFEREMRGEIKNK
jgi:hypothetical protein